MFDIGEMGREDILREISDNIDRLITLDLPFRTVSNKLYADTRALYGDPITLLVARSLSESIQKGGVALIATGWPDRPHVSPDIAETDGPPGAALLGMALHKAKKAVALFLTEERLVAPMEKVCASAGFKVVPLDKLMDASESRAPLHAASVLGFPADVSEAAEAAEDLLNTYPVRAVISIEKGGMNEKGIIHTSRGDDTTGPMAKIDILVRKAREREILTIGIGDGGNEIGMGVIAEDLRQWLPFGKKCKCPCGGGIVPVTETDFLVPTAVSNWGAYGISTMLAILEENREIFHSAEVERQILRTCADAGFIDGGSGYVNGGVDSLPIHVHMSLVDLLGAFAEKGIAAIRNRP
ncbi:MAG: DUF4392 domain-containing protein [Deltaproteobacteria bacterium]|nr:DUF4392 domain-containing protein [Deltaproteobacteria bacterium]MBW2138439.1 DUF4392 domain-containing protein [Deltaproteobacteria bacterium]